MYVWCSRDKVMSGGITHFDYLRGIWAHKPRMSDAGYWVLPNGHALFQDWDGSDDTPAVFSAIFPRGVKPGQCVKVKLKRLEVLT